MLGPDGVGLPVGDGKIAHCYYRPHLCVGAENFLHLLISGTLRIIYPLTLNNLLLTKSIFFFDRGDNLAMLIYAPLKALGFVRIWRGKKIRVSPFLLVGNSVCMMFKAVKCADEWDTLVRPYGENIARRYC